MATGQTPTAIKSTDQCNLTCSAATLPDKYILRGKRCNCPMTLEKKIKKKNLAKNTLSDGTQMHKEGKKHYMSQDNVLLVFVFNRKNYSCKLTEGMKYITF